MKKNYFKNKKILITGATGSIGSILVKSFLKLNCKVVRALSNDENGLYELTKDLDTKLRSNYSFRIKMKKAKIRLLHGDVREYDRCLEATKNIDIVIHAAAMKHLPICEYNQKEALKTNINGTKNMIRASIKSKVKKFLFISTDKVVSPTSILGKTKLSAEKEILNANFRKKGHTIFSAVRFGNVIGSRGSVVPKFLDQIKSNLSLTVTNKNMTRYIMTINTAANLTLKVINNMKGGEIFVLKSMGKFRIYDLAKALLKYFKSKKKIKIIGKVEGEKLDEELFTNKEKQKLLTSKNLYVINYNSPKQKKIKNFQNEKTKTLNMQEIINLLKKELILK